MWQAFMITVVALAQPRIAKAPPVMKADEIVAKVQKYYAATEKLQADFRQEFTNTTFGKTTTSDGKLYIAKPGKMRWDYTKPDKKHLISDGVTLWMYQPADKQAFKKSLKDEILPVAITFLYGQGDIAKDFTAALDPGKYGGKEDYVIKLSPKTPTTQYKHLWLVVDASDFHVKESVILEASDNINHFKFNKIKLNAEAKYVKDSLFKFTPPKDVKVIEPEAAAKKDDGKSNK